MDIVNIFWVFLLLLCFGRLHSTDDESSECKCKNGGDCVTMRNITSCICKWPYKEPTCEESPCHPNPCKNNQSCILTFDSFSCNCNEGYAGDFCDKVLGLCDSTICPSGETCKIVSGKPICFQEISTSSTILSTTEKFSTTTQDESRTTEENSESSTTGNKDSTDIGTQSSNEQILRKRTNGSTPDTESDEYSRITEEYLSNSSLGNSTVSLVVATDAFSYENATSTIYPSVTNTSFDEFNKLSTESDVSNVTDDISTEGEKGSIDLCVSDICHNGGKNCKTKNGQPQCDCPDPFTGPFCELKISTSSTISSTLKPFTHEFSATTESTETTSVMENNTTTEFLSPDTTSDDSTISDERSTVLTTTEDSKTNTEKFDSTSVKEHTTASLSPATTTVNSISSDKTSSFGTTTEDSNTNTENFDSTSVKEDTTTTVSLSPDTTTATVSLSPDITTANSISSNETSSILTTTEDSNTNSENIDSTSVKEANRPSSFGTTTDNSNINTESIYSTTSKEDNTTPYALTAETTQSVASTNTDGTVTEVEIDKKKASKRNVAYICGGIGGGLGIIFFIVGIIYYLKRLKKRKHLLYFKSGDTSSMGSSDSTTHLA